MRKIALVILILSLGVEMWRIAPPTVAHALLQLGYPSIAAKLFSDPSWRGLALYRAGQWNEAARIFATTIKENYNLGNALAQNGHYNEAIAAYERALADQPDDEDAAYNKALLEAALQKYPTPPKTHLSQPVHDSPATKVGGTRDRPLTEDNFGGAGAGLAAGSETQGQGSKGGGAAKDGLILSTAANENNHQSAAAAAGSSESVNQKENAQVNFPDLLQERESRMRRRQQEAGVHPTPEWLQTLPDDPGQYLKLKILAEKARRLNANGGPIPEDD